MNFWKLMIKKDDFICEFINLIYHVKNFFDFKSRILISKNPSFESSELVVVLNGPSLAEQDLSCLGNKSVLFVNRGFNHPLYSQLKPSFHAFVDPKMLTGEWPITWFKDIMSINPDIIFLVPVSWHRSLKIKEVIKEGANIYWLPFGKKCECLGVSGACFYFAINENIKNVYFTGFDGNGIGYELINSNSHFYGVNEENLRKNTNNFVIDLFLHSRHLHDLHKFQKKYSKKGFRFINLTNGGILDMFEKGTLNDIN